MPETGAQRPGNEKPPDEAENSRRKTLESTEPGHGRPLSKSATQQRAHHHDRRRYQCTSWMPRSCTGGHVSIGCTEIWPPPCGRKSNGVLGPGQSSWNGQRVNICRAMALNQFGPSQAGIGDRPSTKSRLCTRPGRVGELKDPE